MSYPIDRPPHASGTAATASEIAPEIAEDFLRTMLEIPSESGNERAVAEYLRDRAHDLGLVSGIDGAGNFVAATSGDPFRTNPSVRDLVLLGHTDVVPGIVPVRREGDRLYGRGAVDAKGPLTAFVLAAAAASLPADTRIVVIGAVEEEAATSRGARAVVPRYSPAACVIGEPSGWDAVTIGYKGRAIVRYERVKPSAHTAGPDPSPADECVRWWGCVLSRLQEINPARAGAFDAVQATLREIRTETDGLHNCVTATAGFRLPPGIEPGRIQDLCASHAGGARVMMTGAETAVVADRRSALVRAFTARIRAHNAKPSLLLKTGTSDMNVVGAAGAWPCPILAYGPGDSSLDHTPDEHISVTEFHRSVRVLRGALEHFALDAGDSHPPGTEPNAY